MYTHIYESQLELVEAANRAIAAGRQHYEGYFDPSFLGRDLCTWDQVLNAAKREWPEGLEVVQEMLYQLRDLKSELRPKSVRRRPRWADDGDEIDNDRLRSGQEPWRVARRESADGPQTVVIFTNVSALGSVRHEDVLWRGAVATALADLLEEAGYRVELWGCRYTSRAYQDHSNLLQAYCLKRAEEPLDLAAVVNGVSAWFFRSAIFQAQYAEPKSRPASTMGVTLQLNPEMPELTELARGARSVVIDGVWTKRDALRLAREALESLAIN